MNKKNEEYGKESFRNFLMASSNLGGSVNEN